MYHLEGENCPIIPQITLVKDEAAGDSFVGIKNIEEKFKAVAFEISGIAIAFSKLKSDKDILRFANGHGLLGIKHKRSAVQFDIKNTGLFEFELEDEPNIFESVKLWRWHIDHVKRLIKLFYTLKNHGDITELLSIEPYKPTKQEESPFKELYEARFLQIAGSTPKKHEEPQYEIIWVEGNKHLHAGFLDEYKEDMKTLAFAILYRDIEYILKPGLFLDYETAKFDPASPLGFSFRDRKATKQLITVIYYDLWKIANNIERVKLCKVCETPFSSQRIDALFCGDTCRKRNERAVKIHAIQG
jgi:hypothetical protein